MKSSRKWLIIFSIIIIILICLCGSCTIIKLGSGTLKKEKEIKEEQNEIEALVGELMEDSKEEEEKPANEDNFGNSDSSEAQIREEDNLYCIKIKR